jgi:hypothetical protein
VMPPTKGTIQSENESNTEACFQFWTVFLSQGEWTKGEYGSPKAENYTDNKENRKNTNKRLIW